MIKPLSAVANARRIKELTGTIIHLLRLIVK